MGGSPVPGILQARVLEWGAIAFSDFEGRAPQNTTLHCFPQVGTVCGKENKWPRFEWLTKVGISSGVGGLQAQRTACDIRPSLKGPSRVLSSVPRQAQEAALLPSWVMEDFLN